VFHTEKTKQKQNKTKQNKQPVNYIGMTSSSGNEYYEMMLG